MRNYHEASNLLVFPMPGSGGKLSISHTSQQTIAQNLDAKNPIRHYWAHITYAIQSLRMAASQAMHRPHAVRKPKMQPSQPRILRLAQQKYRLFSAIQPQGISSSRRQAELASDMHHRGIASDASMHVRPPSCMLPFPKGLESRQI